MKRLQGKIMFFLISAGVPWKDERFFKDLQRWRNVNNMKGTDKEVLCTLLASDKAFRTLYIYRQKNRLYRRWVKFQNKIKLLL